MMPILNLGFTQIPTFYLAISIALSMSLLYLSVKIDRNNLSDNHFKVNRKIAFDLTLVLMICGFLGGRILHITYEEWDFYQTFPLEMFKFWKGGFVFYGGLIAALIGAMIFLKHRKENFFFWADFIVPFVSLAYALGRMGCFFQGCCYGSFCEYPWAIEHRHPTQLYMVFAELFLFVILNFLIKTTPTWFDATYEKRQTSTWGYLFLTWLGLHALSRFVIEYFREDDRGQFVAQFSVSQIISFVLILFSFGTLIYLRLRSKTSRTM